MKKLVKIFSVLMVFVGSFAFGQSDKQISPNNPPLDINNEDRIKLATMVATMKDNLSIVYTNGATYETFRSKALGRVGVANTQEGEAILNKVYNYLDAGKTSEQIINTDSGKEMIDLIKKLKTAGSDGYALFSTIANQPKLDTNFDPRQHEAKSGCKWYQLDCWSKAIFGVGILALISFVIAL